MEDLRFDDVLMQFFNEKLVLNIQGVDQYDKDIDIIRIVFTLVVLMIYGWMFDDSAN